MAGHIPFVTVESLTSRVGNRYPSSLFSTVKGKSKAIPLQTWTGPEGSRRLRFPDFKTIGTRIW